MECTVKWTGLTTDTGSKSGMTFIAETGSGHTLRVIASGCANHAFFELRRAQMRHLVVSPAQLETEHRLLVFTLEQDSVFQARTKGFGGLQPRFDRHVIHTGGEDFFQVISRRQVFFHGL